jgi:hypothetical protein
MLEGLVKGAFLGATFGAVIWIPGLIATLVAFGLPIAWAQKRAERGLAGEERGELVIGIVAAGISLLSFLLLSARPWPTVFESGQSHESSGRMAIAALVAVGFLSGVLAAAFSTHRERARRRFVRKVETGAVQGYRIDETNEGKVLLRVTSLGSGYRVANFEELLAVLDENGETRSGQA